MTKFPIRARLTLWYLLLMLVTFMMIAIYLLTRFQVSLKSTIDSSLQITVSKTINALDEEDFKETGKLTFDHVRQTQVTPATDFAMQIISAQGMVWDTYGSAQSVPQWGEVDLGYSTQTSRSNNEEWRIYSEPVLNSNGQIIAWVQAAQSLTRGRSRCPTTAGSTAWTSSGNTPGRPCRNAQACAERSSEMTARGDRPPWCWLPSRVARAIACT